MRARLSELEQQTEKERSERNRTEYASIDELEAKRQPIASKLNELQRQYDAIMDKFKNMKR